jgi:hypothetical protein
MPSKTEIINLYHQANIIIFESHITVPWQTRDLGTTSLEII